MIIWILQSTINFFVKKTIFKSWEICQSFNIYEAKYSSTKLQENYKQ
jgi:hypothetical protein